MTRVALGSGSSDNDKVIAMVRCVTVAGTACNVALIR